MQRLYFVRHGESEANAAQIWSPYNTPLTDLGRWQATAAGCDARHRGLQFDAILSSPTPRAHETAKRIAQELDYDHRKIELVDSLNERNWGRVAGQPKAHFLSDGRVYKDLDDLEGTESLQSLQQRTAGVLDSLQKRKEQNILVVSHGTFGRALLRELQGLPSSAAYTEPKANIPHARILHIYPND